MTDLLDLATSIVARASSGEDIEAFVTHERNFHVKAYSGDIESLASAEPRGAGASSETIEWDLRSLPI